MYSSWHGRGGEGGKGGGEGRVAGDPVVVVVEAYNTVCYILVHQEAGSQMGKWGRQLIILKACLYSPMSDS